MEGLHKEKNERKAEVLSILSWSTYLKTKHLSIEKENMNVLNNHIKNNYYLMKEIINLVVL